MRILRVALAVAIIIGSGLVYGGWTYRWRQPQSVQERIAQLESVPATIGEWSGTPLKMSESEMALAGVSAYLSRRYINAQTGDALTVLVVNGLPGTIAAHPPTVCYPGAGFELETPALFVMQGSSPEVKAEFRTSVARKSHAVTPEQLRIYWSWTGSGSWSVPDEPRWIFASLPDLCKLYVVRRIAGPVKQPEDDPCHDFLKQFLPALSQALFTRDRGTASTAPSRSTPPGR
jgi:hypothetical protein